MKSVSCQNLASVRYRSLTQREVTVNSTVFSGDWNSFTYVYESILLLSICTCNELEAEACKPSDASATK